MRISKAGESLIAMTPTRASGTESSSPKNGGEVGGRPIRTILSGPFYPDHFIRGKLQQVVHAASFGWTTILLTLEGNGNNKSEVLERERVLKGWNKPVGSDESFPLSLLIPRPRAAKPSRQSGSADV
jgi:hypothetical protein